MRLPFPSLPFPNNTPKKHHPLPSPTYLPVVEPLPLPDLAHVVLARVHGKVAAEPAPLLVAVARGEGVDRVGGLVADGQAVLAVEAALSLVLVLVMGGMWWLAVLPIYLWIWRTHTDRDLYLRCTNII